MTRAVVESLIGMLPASLQTSARQFLKFAVTGVVGAIVDFGTYNLITRVFGWTDYYTVWGQKIIIANNISVFLAIISNFILNKYWTFRDPSKQVMRQYMAYFGLNVVTWVLNQLLVSIFTFQVLFMDQVFGDQKDNAAKVLAIGIILFLNFFGSKFLIFKKKPALVNG